jgi:hypothetical protein
LAAAVQAATDERTDAPRSYAPALAGRASAAWRALAFVLST